MSLLRQTSPFDLIKRKQPSSQLDLRSPEMKTISRDDGDEHKSIWSPQIEEALVNWAHAKETNDDAALTRAGRQALAATSNYFRMSGMPAYAHYPLPPQLVEAEVGHVRHLPPDEANNLIRRFTNVFDTEAQPFINQQVLAVVRQGDMAGEALIEPRSPSEPHNFDPAVARRSAVQDNGGGKATANWSQYASSPAGDAGPAFPADKQGDGWGPRYRDKWTRSHAVRGNPQYATPTGANGALDEDVGEAYDQDGLLPDSPTDRFGPPWYDPGAWRREHDPRSAGKTRLIGPESLTDAQKKNLAERNWMFPTNGEPEYGAVGPDYPYFGARRRSGGGRSTYHAGYDARFRKPSAGSNQRVDKTIVAPTRARFIGFERYALDGKTVINAVKFDLGDGLVLEMLHVEPTAQILALDRQVRAAEARGGRPARPVGEWHPVPGVNYPELDAGVTLGEVDAHGSPRQHDHTHMQLITYQGGQRSSVDITPYMERRARRYFRSPANDWLDRRYDDFFGDDLPKSILPPS